MLIKGIDYELVSGDEFNPAGRKYKLLRDFPFFYRTQRVVIPKGFMWDGPSGVPILWGLYRSWENPALVHDFFYQNRGVIEDQNLVITRQEADETFFAMLLQNGVSPIFPTVMRLFLGKILQKVWDREYATASGIIKGTFSPLTLMGAGMIVAALLMGLSNFGAYLLL